MIAPPLAPARRLPAVAWQAAAATHAERADALTAGRRERRARGASHPIDDFLYDYYGLTPARLRRWHPGVGTGLAPAGVGTGLAPAGGAAGPSPGNGVAGSHHETGAAGSHADPADDGPRAGLPPHAAWRWYRTEDDGTVTLDVTGFLADRGPTVRYIHHLLTATAGRPAFTGCLGLHEWAMVYRQEQHRHTLPLRLGQDGTDAVVESHRLRCSHIDAFRFFTPDAVPRNQLRPTRETQPDLEQPGCLHANMDLLKWSLKLGPAVPGDLLLDCAELARDVRLLDMQASPYDVSSLGEPAVAIETPQGKAEYVMRQRELADRAALLRCRVVEVCAQVDQALDPGTLDPSATPAPGGR